MTRFYSPVKSGWAYFHRRDLSSFDLRQPATEDSAGRRLTMFIERHLEDKIIAALPANPAVALLGPRQCGKSTLAKKLAERLPGFLYLDLESEADLNKLNQPELFFQHNADRLVCLDEIQRRPHLFPILRSVLDRRGTNAQLLLLGSASPDLINRSSESPAGRIAYLELTPFLAGARGLSAQPLG
jgi:predicted AAA+ superfamily ATPase